MPEAENSFPRLPGRLGAAAVGEGAQAFWVSLCVTDETFEERFSSFDKVILVIKHNTYGFIKVT